MISEKETNGWPDTVDPTTTTVGYAIPERTDVRNSSTYGLPTLRN